MKFGLFFELSVPRPLSRADEQQVIVNTLEQARLADELGFARQAAELGLGMVRQFNYLNTHQLWNKEVYPTASYKTLSNLAPGKAQRPPRIPPERSPCPRAWRSETVRRSFEPSAPGSPPGGDSINFLINCIETIPQHAVLEGLRLFAREVMPTFKSSSESRVAAA
jgi:hypothetical protein